MSPPWRRRAEGLELAVRVTPRGGVERFDGVRTDAAGQSWLQVRLTAAADRGRANEALRRLVARTLGVPPSAVDLLAGHTSRQKRLLVRGDPAALEARAAGLGGTDASA